MRSEAPVFVDAAVKGGHGVMGTHEGSNQIGRQSRHCLSTKKLRRCWVLSGMAVRVYGSSSMGRTQVEQR
jgi:hypothetical protein